MKRKIYGVSRKFDFGQWNHAIYVFDNANDSEKWLNTEEYDFRNRELMTKTEAIKLAGRNVVNEAMKYEEMRCNYAI